MVLVIEVLFFNILYIVGIFVLLMLNLKLLVVFFWGFMLIISMFLLKVKCNVVLRLMLVVVFEILFFWFVIEIICVIIMFFL